MIRIWEHRDPTEAWVREHFGVFELVAEEDLLVNLLAVEGPGHSIHGLCAHLSTKLIGATLVHLAHPRSVLLVLGR